MLWGDDHRACRLLVACTGELVLQRLSSTLTDRALPLRACSSTLRWRKRSWSYCCMRAMRSRSLVRLSLRSRISLRVGWERWGGGDGGGVQARCQSKQNCTPAGS